MKTSAKKVAIPASICCLELISNLIAFLAINARNLLTFGLTYFVNDWVTNKGPWNVFDVLGSSFSQSKKIILAKELSMLLDILAPEVEKCMLTPFSRRSGVDNPVVDFREENSKCNCSK
jgi:hypothetical protein